MCSLWSNVTLELCENTQCSVNENKKKTNLKQTKTKQKHKHSKNDLF